MVERSRLHTIFMNVPAAISILAGSDHVCLLSNPANDRITGRPLRIGVPIGEAWPESVRQGLVDALDRVYATGEPFVGREVRLEVAPADCTGENEVILDLGCVALRDGGGRIESVLVFAYDVSELVRSRLRAEEANRAKDVFLSTLSHELRTPLTAIVGWTRLLQTDAMPPDKRARALETISRNARMQTALIEDIFDISRIVTGQLQLDIAPADVANILEVAVETFGPAAEAKRIRLDLDVAHDLGTVLADSNRLQQIVWNLLSNALKFTPVGGRVQVRASVRDYAIEIEVQDSGEGISGGFMPHVFERFRQAESSVTHAHGGLGLGLSIVKHLVELHGGTIDAKSAGEGNGALFTVRIPARRERPITRPRHAIQSASRSVALSTAPGPATVAGLRVLAVGGDGTTREVLADALAGRGATVALAKSIAEALVTLERAPPDLVIISIGEQVESASGLVRDIRALPAIAGGRVPVVALGSGVDSQARARAYAAGLDVWLTVPMDPDELSAVVANLTRRGSSRER